jgi:hypothetical protein
VPELSTEGIILQDRFVVGTYSADQYHDVVTAIVFESDPAENSFIIINGSLVRFYSQYKIDQPSPNFPVPKFNVEVHILRGSTLPLDYVRDLVIHMGVPVGELMDVVLEDTVISIICSTTTAAAILIRRGPLFSPGGMVGWRMIPKDPMVLPAVAEIFNPTGPTPVLSDYPGSIFDVRVTRAIIRPLSQAKRMVGAAPPSKETVPPMVPPPPPKLGPQFKAITFLPRPPVGESLGVLASSTQNVSILSPIPQPPSMVSLSLHDQTRGKKRNSGDMESQSWSDILVCNSLSDYQIELLISIIRTHVTISASLSSQLSIIVSPVCNDSSMEVDGDLKS